MSDFQLVDLTSNLGFSFQYFPESIRWSERVNWSQQDTTIGTKPLFYQNTDARTLTVNDLVLDGTGDNRNIVPELNDLRNLKAEREELGMPTPLLAAWGGQKFRCVLQSLEIEENYFHDSGFPMRARINLELVELQNIGATTSVNEGPIYTNDVDPG